METIRSRIKLVSAPPGTIARPPEGSSLVAPSAEAPFLRVGAVAGEAAAGEERLDVAGKVDGVSGGGLVCRDGTQERTDHNGSQGPRMSNRVNRHGTSCQTGNRHSTLRLRPERGQFTRGSVCLRRREPPPLS